jgi:hypothetical protein
MIKKALYMIHEVCPPLIIIEKIDGGWEVMTVVIRYKRPENST